MAEIRLEGLHKAFADFVAVEEVNLTIGNGQFFVLLGPSGCGKTTTLRMIAGLELPTSGAIHLDGEDVTTLRPAKRDIAFVFQLFALYPHMNVRRNMAYPLRSQGMARGEIKQRVGETARLLRIDHLLDQPVSRLAGGDRQRVALGRAIVRRPRAFLMDEPLGTLDAAFRELMCEELRGLHNRIGATTVYVTHDQIEAMAMADVIAVMHRGRVLQAAPPTEIYHRPRSLFVANFIGSPAMNFLDCAGGLGRGARTVELAGTSTAVPELHADASQERLIFGIRPEHVRVKDDAPLRGEVFGVEYMGMRQILTVDTPAGRLRVRAPNSVRATPGERIGLAFEPGAAVLFDPATERALPSALIPEAAHG